MPNSYDDWMFHIDEKLRPTLKQLRNDLLLKLSDSQLAVYRDALSLCPDIEVTSSSLDTPAIKVAGAPTENELKDLKKALEAFVPWKKGPFDLFGVEIDAEWRSDLKWERIIPHIKPITDHIIADIGCHNGYFMFRMAEHHPKAVIGFEPYAKHWYNFQLLNKFFGQNNLFFELFGVENMDLFPNSFDSIFCLGILYHHTDPVNLLRKMRLALRKKGQLIIDCQGVPGDDPVAYVPNSKYAGARGIWFLPTRACLENWIRRAGFQNVETFFAEPLSTCEQRSSEWAPIKSLKDFLNEDKTRTIEGHPPPWRYYVKASI